VKLSPRRRRLRKATQSSSDRRRPRLHLEHLEERIVPDVSAPAILQMFEATDGTVENRAADIFNAGYGTVYLPPPGRADSGNQSVGYDVYNRFDLGSPGNPTLYGTETGLKTTVNALHTAAVNVNIDLVLGHDGFTQANAVDSQGNSFANAGGYPGFTLSTPTDPYGDFYAPNDPAPFHGQLGGLITIAPDKNYQYVRNPVPGNPNDLPAGTIPAFGRLANVPDPTNTRFYPDQSQTPIYLNDPATGQFNFPVYPFNNANPQNGTPVSENDLGYLMRYTQWLVQYVGTDGFRIDAAKNMPPWVLNYVDRAVYRSSFRTQLDGSQEPIFSYSEVYDGNAPYVASFVRKDINPSNPSQVGGNRDVLDFPLYFAMAGNLTGNGLQNDWHNIINASVEGQFSSNPNDGGNGVAFVSNQDVPPPYLDNLAYAYMLMRPGNAIVYFNAHQFGTDRNFPNDGRGDALGGLYGNTITNLVNIRDTHPGGNFILRDLEKETLIYERDNSLIFAGSNRLDSGYDSRTIQTDFAPGTPLIELTGNATDPNLDPDGAIPPLLVVNPDGTVNLRVPRNTNDSGVQTNKGYAIWGLAGPQGSLTITNVDHVIPGGTPTSSTNGTTVLSNADVITGNSFQIQMNTNAVNLLGFYRDQNTDGDNALFKVDGGIALNGDPGVDYTTPNTVSYGFENFNTVHSPGYFNSNGNGQYIQTIDATKLSDGYHYITVRVFRHRSDGGPPVFTDFKQVIYIDHTHPTVQVQSFQPIIAGVNENQQLTVISPDERANSVHVLWDLPAADTNAQILGLLSPSNQANQIDRNLFTANVYGLTSGNHVATVVTYDVSGDYSIQRFPGLYTQTIYGAGLGDVNFDGQYTSADVTQFDTILTSNNTQFNSAADLNGDGVIDNTDLLLLYPRLQTVGASAATLATYTQILGPTTSAFTTSEGNGVTLTVNQPSGTTPNLTFSWSLNNGPFTDATGATATLTWSQLVSFGINDGGTYPIALQVSDGVTTTTFSSSVVVSSVPPSAGISGHINAVRGEPRNYTLTATDPSPLDLAAGFTYVINWGDGSTQTVTGPSSTTVGHIYVATGTYPIQVTAADFHGQVGPTANLTVKVSAAALQVDPFDNTKTALVVGGTTGQDTIVLQPGAVTGSILVTVNGVTIGPYSPTGYIFITGQGGGDSITLQAGQVNGAPVPILVPAMIWAGPGNSTIDARGSSANNVLVGGKGNNTLYGGGGADILIGGTGASSLYAGTGGDILIGGYTDFGSNPAALYALSNEWSRTDISYSAKISDLMGTTSGGKNGPYLLTPTTVHNFAAVYTLVGGQSGMNWFFGHVPGTTTNHAVIKSKKPGEVVTVI
jgi:hypothetical protein